MTHSGKCFGDVVTVEEMPDGLISVLGSGKVAGGPKDTAERVTGVAVTIEGMTGAGHSTARGHPGAADTSELTQENVIGVVATLKVMMQAGHTIVRHRKSLRIALGAELTRASASGSAAMMMEDSEAILNYFIKIEKVCYCIIPGSVMKIK